MDIIWGVTKSRKKHPLFGIWKGMKKRCYQVNRKDYKNYGARGIRVCSRWLSDFWNFVEDMEPRPDGCTLDRIENSGDYSPENCEWSSKSKQQANRRSNGKYLRGAYKTSNGKFISRIQVNKKYRHLGVFDTEIEAHHAYVGAFYVEYGKYPP